MKLQLIINFYQDNNPERSQELKLCLCANLLNPLLSKIIIIVADKDTKNLEEIIKKTGSKKWQMVIYNERPTLNYFFSLSSENYINIIANTDIIIDDESTKKLINWDFKNRVLSLSRWDFSDKSIDKNTAILFNRSDSQDVWIKKGAFTKTTGGDICLGKPGIDNKIAFLLEREHGFNVINPSLTIKTFHLHLTGVRNYISNTGKTMDVIPPPYKLVHPIHLPE